MALNLRALADLKNAEIARRNAAAAAAVGPLPTSGGLKAAFDYIKAYKAAGGVRTDSPGIGTFFGDVAKVGLVVSGAVAAAPLAGAASSAIAGTSAATTGATTMSLSSILRDAAKSTLNSVIGNFLPAGVTPTGINSPSSLNIAQLMEGAMAANQASAMPAAFPVALPSLGQVGAAALGLVGGAVRAGVGIIRSVGGRILGIMLPSGQRVTRKAAVNLAKQMGVTAAATALGVTAVELAELIVQESQTKRRGRGISQAQLRTTRSTMRRVMGMHRQIVQACSSARVPSSRRRSSGGKFPRLAVSTSCK